MAQNRTMRFIRSLFIHTASIPQSADDMHEFFEEHPHSKPHNNSCLVCIDQYVYVWREGKTHGNTR